jgi:hypothetical protein
VWESTGVLHESPLQRQIFVSIIPHPDTMFLALPLEIWEIIFDLLPGRDLQSISKVGLSIGLPTRRITN